MGLFDAAFPRLLPGIVVHLNRAASCSFDECAALDEQILQESNLQRAMLFELAIAAAESLLAHGTISNWEECIRVAGNRQRRFYDAQIPTELTPLDMDIARHIARNLATMLRYLSSQYGGELRIEPPIPGFGWIDPGVGDYSVSDTIIEVKCHSAHFASSDYRQVLIYWLLSYLDSLENQTQAWRRAVLLNPRLNFAVDVTFEELVGLVSGGRSTIEVVQVFSAMILQEWNQ